MKIGKFELSAKYIAIAVAILVVIYIMARNVEPGEEGLASNAKYLDSLSDVECLGVVDQIIEEEERGASAFERAVSGPFTRKAFYTDGSVDFVCLPNQVMIIVYFNNSGAAHAQQDLDDFLGRF